MSARLLVPMAVSISAAIAAASLMTGCNNESATRSAPESKPAAETKEAAPKAAITYKEVEHDGRIFVVGTEKGHAAIESGHLPYSRTLIGAGPMGKTVVIEVDKKQPEVVDALEAEFMKRNPFYREVVHDNRIYVIGSAETLGKFYSSPHLPYTRTFIGAGPGGKTVVIELDKKDAELLPRLIAQFEKFNGAKLN